MYSKNRFAQSSATAKPLSAVNPIHTIAITLLIASIITFVMGCHRGYYRRQADAEAERLIREKSCDPRWSSATDGTILIDPQSRMFDPFSSDHPPIPPDDPSSHQLMRCVDGKQGYPHWHANGDTNFVENPEWRSYLPVNDQGQVVLDMETAYQLALIHSPDLQQQREELYLSALDVSLERFGFDSQLFAGYNSFLETQGRRRGGGRSSTTISSTLGQNSEGINLNKLGITGANFAVGLANSIIWNFAGADTQTATSLIDFSVVQPLLRGAGRERILEALTQSERTLLANVRQMDRFRRGFYLEIITGRNAGTGPLRGGNFLNLPGGAGFGVGGYLGLLQQQQQIRIQESNVRQLEDVLEQFREFFRRERINSLQVRQFESTLYSAQESLLESKTRYQTALDDFKRDLGLPPGLDVVIKDPYLDRFEFISDETTVLQTDINSLRSETGEVLNLVDGLLPGSAEQAEEEGFESPEELEEQVAKLKPYIDRGLRFLKYLQSEARSQMEADFAKLARVRPERIKYLAKLRSAIQRGEMLGGIETKILQASSIRTPAELTEYMETTLANAEKTAEEVKAISERVNDFSIQDSDLSRTELYNLVDEQIVKETSEKFTELYNHALELSLLQAQARGYSIELPEVELNDDFAFNVAKCFRRDLMNARASLVDQWRAIEFFADQLEAEIDLVFEGDIGNNGNNPFKLRSSNGSLRAGFRIDSPIVRLAERNQYRQALIDYQQAKRQFYQFEDELHRILRDEIRNLNLNKILFELGRQNIQVAIEQVELARLSLEDPSATSLGATTARDLTQAINGLQNAQNQFLNVWVTYEVGRRSLDFDLGTFQLGPDGSWIDPEIIDESIASRAAAMMGVELEGQFCCLINPENLASSNTMVTDESAAPDELDSGNNPDDDVERPGFEPENDPPASRRLPQEVPLTEPRTTPRLPVEVPDPPVQGDLFDSQELSSKDLEPEPSKNDIQRIIDSIEIVKTSATGTNDSKVDYAFADLPIDETGKSELIPTIFHSFVPVVTFEQEILANTPVSLTPIRDSVSKTNFETVPTVKPSRIQMSHSLESILFDQNPKSDKKTSSED